MNRRSLLKALIGLPLASKSVAAGVMDADIHTVTRKAISSGSLSVACDGAKLFRRIMAKPYLVESLKEATFNNVEHLVFELLRGKSGRELESLEKAFDAAERNALCV